MKFLSPQFPVTAAQGRNDMMTFSDDWVVASSTIRWMNELTERSTVHNF